MFQKSAVFKFYFDYKSNVLIKEKLGDTCSFKEGKNNLLSHHIDINHLDVPLDFFSAQCLGNAYNNKWTNTLHIILLTDFYHFKPIMNLCPFQKIKVDPIIFNGCIVFTILIQFI